MSNKLVLGLIVALTGAGGVVAMAHHGGSTAKQEKEIFRWHGPLAAGKWVRARTLSGDVVAEPAKGAEAEVWAVARWERSDPGIVSIEKPEGEGGITFCALWPARERHCAADGSYGLKGTPDREDDDVEVIWHVALPKGVSIDGLTTNGNVTITGATAPAVARTTNGNVTVDTTVGPAEAVTTNGNVELRVAAGPARAHTTNGNVDAVLVAPAAVDQKFTTTNGNVDVTIPANADFELSARTSTGAVRSDFALPERHRDDYEVGQEVNARLGKGGPKLTLVTTNGSIRLRRK